MNKKLLGVFGLLTICICLSFTETPDLKSLLTSLQTFLERNPQEKVFIHFDKVKCGVKDTLWFKAYVTAGLENRPSPLSKVLYVDILDKTKKVQHSIILQLKDGLADGYYALKEDEKAGQYHVVAYTKWMLNFSKDYLFHQPVEFIDISNPTDDNKTNLELGDIQFFPEGGNLINGLAVKVGVKAINTNGLGVKTNGTIFNQSNSAITSFSTNEEGFGIVSFVPKENETYIAKVANGLKEFRLPQVLQSGANITVTNKQENSDVVVKVLSTQPAKFFLVVDSRGFLVHATEINLQTSFVFVKFPKEKLLPGISRLTLFDATFKPVAERIIYKDDDAIPSLTFSSLSTAKPRQKIIVKGNIPLKEDDLAFLSASFVDQLWLANGINQVDILSYLNLGSEITGYIENPSQYIDKNKPARWDKLELLLLTQGWRRITWTDVQKTNQDPVKFLPEQNLSLSGKVLDKFNNKPADGAKVTLIEGNLIDGDVIIVKTDSEGKFLFSELNLKSGNEFKIVAENKRGNKEVVKIILDENPFVKELESISLPAFKSNTDSLAIKRITRFEAIEKAYAGMKTILLEGIEVKGERVKSENEERKIYGAGTTTIKAENVVGSQTFTSPLQFLQGRVPGVSVTGNGPSSTVTIRGIGSVTASNEPLILFDNVPISIASLNSIPAINIESVDIFKGADASIFGTQGANGVIAFYSKKGIGSVYAETPGSLTAKDFGLQVKRERYEASYEVKKPEHIKPDERITLHWQPYLKVNKKGDFEISFFASDMPGIISGTIQGLTKKGKPVYGVVNVEVE
ncbi:MAG: TonB-dependent receptor plug domain-containing protein [Cyclobacteriaceae bacterium]|nr:TonB-dependent receptor plug domain-containing protein [Cyclobacteriaceae bacterium]